MDVRSVTLFTIRAVNGEKRLILSLEYMKSSHANHVVPYEELARDNEEDKRKNIPLLRYLQLRIKNLLITLSS